MSEYNGWSNYETWAVNLWISNDQGTYTYWQERAATHRAEARTCTQVKEGIWTEQNAAVFNLADEMKNEISDGVPELETSMYTDLLSSALGEVNWEEIAESWFEE